MLITIAFVAGVAVAQPQSGEAAGSAIEVDSAAQSVPAPESSLYATMVAAAAEVGRRGELPADDSTDQARRMASTDRDEERYFNRPGATRAQYEREWHGCRQIARRLATSRSDGSVMQSAFIHGGLAGGILLGGLDAAFSQRRARRDIRRQCLIARGWRMVEPDEAGRLRIAALPRPEREAYFDRMLVAAETETGATVTDLAAIEAGTAGIKPDGGGEN